MTKKKTPPPVIDPITVGQAAAAHGVNRSRIHKLLQEDRIIGAQQLENGQWLIPRAFTVAQPPKRKRGLEKMV